MPRPTGNKERWIAMSEYYWNYDEVDDMPEPETESEDTGLFNCKAVKEALDSLLMKRSMLKQIFETARWKFFADNSAGQKILKVMDLLHERYPDNRIIGRIWFFCLPF